MGKRVLQNPLSLELLAGLLPEGVTPVVFETLPSTSTYLREQALNGAPVNTLIAAASQTNGRGRFGRDFFSPPDTGVYFSILLRPDTGGDTAAWITVAAAIASAEACEAVFSVPAEIKWVNDVLVNGQKAVGILAEAFSGGDSVIILGIGANIAQPDGGFPPELSQAGAFTSVIKTDEGKREHFIAETITRLRLLLENDDKKALVETYRKRVHMTGKTVMVTKGSERFSATVLGVDDEAYLVIKRDGGEIEHLSYGEVSLHNENV